VLDANGRLDRRRLREIIFADATARRRLEAILHPAIRADMERQSRAAGGAYQLLVIPLLTEGDVRFVDIGANLGSFSIWLAQQRNVISSYCFEPEPDSFRLLSFNLSLNGCEGVTPIHAAVGGTQREISIQLKSSSPGGTSIYSDGYSDAVQDSSRARIKVMAFSQWLNEAATPFDLLKLDCEGAEWEIVRACGHILAERFKVVVAEVHDDPDKESAVDAFPKVMEKHGFSTLRWDGKSQGLYVGKRVP